MEYTFDTNRQGDSYMQHTIQQPATASGTFTIGGDLTVYRLGFGTMRLTGPGIWGPPKAAQRKARSDCARLAPQTLKYHAAHPWHFLGEASRREHGWSDD